MPASKNKKTDGGDGVAKAEVLNNEEDSPVVSRTRSGRKLHTPLAKTPVRRTRKSVVREDPVESTEESPPDERPADTKGDQCSQVTETVCPDVSTSTSTSADVSQEPLPATSDLIGSDQASEKENVVNNTETESTGPKKKAKKRNRSKSSEKKSQIIPLGKPKSGRVWKDRTKQRFSALLRDKPLRTSWGKKMEAKREKQLVKQFQQQLKDEQIREKEEKRKRREEHLKRRAENERKAEIVQVIKNTSKIKRMKKKTLRKIEKRDTLSMLQKTPPSVKKGSGKTKSSL
ncbi:coiled-coil domain-containing protein 86 [Garra rufa]|uniref:coiled-coil domain-containing protein 86 n=1 Tax=Garra rufa TaxID=137080 RepID=UPI003CCEBC26